MKKFLSLIAFLMLAIMTFSFIGCNNPAASDPATEAENSGNNGETPFAGETTPATDTSGQTSGNGSGSGSTATGPTEAQLATPLTLKAIEAGTITFNNPWQTFKYKRNGGNFETVTATQPDPDDEFTTASITVAADDVIEFYADGSENDLGEDLFFSIICSNPCFVYGNVMSLEASENFNSLVTINEDAAFTALFGNEDDINPIKNHPENPLLLPATNITTYCYAMMFYNCGNLENAPVLPATTLEEGCYYAMFSGCSDLTNAPALPATTLADECYCEMFDYCSSLATAPNLPATTLADSCYYEMFSNCSSLTQAPALAARTLFDHCYDRMFSRCTSLSSAPELPATTLARYCYYEMFKGCTSLTNVPDQLPATSLQQNCYYSMFEGCTRLTAGPELPAATMVRSCYARMFKGCSSLSQAPALPATSLATYCYENMFENCSSLTRAPELNASTLVESCYSYMFNGCSSLNYVKCLATNYEQNQWGDCGYTNGWLSGTASSGERIFVKANGTNWGNSSNSGIPSDWTVQTPVREYRVNIGNLTNGSITASSLNVTAGTEVTLTITTTTGCKLESISVTKASGGEVTLRGSGNSSGSTRTFTMPAEDVNVTADFTYIDYTVTLPAASSYGTVTCTDFYGSPYTTAHVGNSMFVSVSPAAGYNYSITVIKEHGGTITPNRFGGFTMPDDNITISVNYTPINYSVTLPETLAHGSITTDQSSNLHVGDTVNLSITIDEGYSLESLSVKNGTADVAVSGTGGNRSFTMPAGNVTVSAVIRQISFNISVINGTAKNSSGATITKADVGTRVTIVADNPTGQREFLNWTSSNTGLSFTSSTSANTTFTMPESNVSITANYQNYYTVSYADGVDNAEITVPGDSRHYHNGDTVNVSFTGVGNRDHYNFSGWSDGTNTYTSNGTTSFTIGSTNVTLTALWAEISAPVAASTETKAVGDIILNDGTFVRYADRSLMSSAQKSNATAIIFDAETQKGVGLVIGEDKAWCSTGAALYNNNDLATSTSDGLANSNALHPRMGVWDAPSYPAFWYAEHYSSGIYTSGWYMPASGELYKIFCKVEEINNAYTALGLTSPYGGDPSALSNWFWSSTTNTSYSQNKAVFLSDAANEGGAGVGKEAGLKVCAIHVF